MASLLKSAFSFILQRLMFVLLVGVGTFAGLKLFKPSFVYDKDGNTKHTGINAFTLTIMMMVAAGIGSYYYSMWILRSTLTQNLMPVV